MAKVAGRKRSASSLAANIVGEVWHHSNNRDHRVRAVARSLAWQVRKRLPISPGVRTVYGSMKVRMDPSFGSASNLIYFGDRYDPDLMGFLEAVLEPGDNFADVGANIGTYTLLAATLVGPEGHIDCFEPVPSLNAAVHDNLGLSGIADQVTVHAVAVSDSHGEVAFMTTKDVSSRMAVATDPEALVERVPMVPLDELFDPERPWAVLKIDVEGAEVLALRGMTGVLAHEPQPPLLLEVREHQLKRLGSTSEELLGLLAAAGYELTSLGEDFELATIDPGTKALVGDFIAVPTARRAEIADRLRDHARRNGRARQK